MTQKEEKKLNYKISFNFDDNTRQVTDVKVVTEGEPETQPIRDGFIELTKTSLQLTPEVLQDLNTIRQGAKIAISFEPGGIVKLINPKLYPVAGDGASLSGKFTISIRGKNNEALTKLGTKFRTQRLQPGVVLLHPIPTEIVEEKALFDEPEPEVNFQSLDEEE